MVQVLGPAGSEPPSRGRTKERVVDEHVNDDQHDDEDASGDEEGEDEEEEETDIEYHIGEVARWLVTRSALAEREEDEEGENESGIKQMLERLEQTLTKVDKTLDKLYRHMKQHNA